MLRYPSAFPWGKVPRYEADEGNLYRKTKRENIPFIVYQICNISREVVNALPYEYNISLQFGYPLYMRRRHRNVTEGNTSQVKRTSRCQSLHGTKSCFVSTKSIALPYEGLIYIYQNLWDDGLILF